jgi:HEAT repeat protein
MTQQALTNEQLKQFLLDGYMIIPPTQLKLSTQFHAELFKTASEVLEREGNPGNNILPRIPQLQQVFDDEKIVGTLQRMLGHNYVMQAHRFPHLTKKGKAEQLWHKDSFFGYKRPIRHPQLRNVMLMYYPQKTTLAMGPTAVRKGTHYYSVDPKRYQGKLNNEYAGEQMKDLDHYIECEAGSVVIIHYDIIHRGTRNSSSDRFMFKFQFNRVLEPLVDVLDVPAVSYEKVNPLNNNYNKALEPVAKSVWDWMHNIEFTPGKSISNLKLLEGPIEAERFSAAYQVGLSGDHATLIKQLSNEDEQFRLIAAHGLVACRTKAAVNAVISELQLSKDAPLDKQIAFLFVLSEWGPLVTKILSDSELKDFVKQLDPKTVTGLHNHSKLYLAEALGTIFCNSDASNGSLPEVLELLSKLLRDYNDQTRFTAALSIARIGTAATSLVPVLKDVLYSDKNRYVHANILTALERVGSIEAMKILLSYLKASRWCHITTKKSQF